MKIFHSLGRPGDLDQPVRTAYNYSPNVKIVFFHFRTHSTFATLSTGAIGSMLRF